MGYQVLCVDNNVRKVATLQDGVCPIHEEHLSELLNCHRNARLEFTDDLGEAVRDADVVFIAVGTPARDTGNADLSYVEAVTNEIAQSLTHYTVIVEKALFLFTQARGFDESFNAMVFHYTCSM
jgi:UDPglucose 6-dehydrogenase